MTTIHDRGNPSGLFIGSAGSRPPRASDTAYAWLMERIAELPRDVGTVISESDVVSGSGTGRTPAREAVQRLESEGFLQIIPRKGIYILPVSDTDVISLMEARRLIEVWSVERAISSGVLADGRLQRLLDEQVRQVGSASPFIEGDRLFHSTLVNAGGNAVLSTFYEQLRDRQVRVGISAIAATQYREDEVLSEHQAIATAIAEGDCEAARATISEHIDKTLAVLLTGRN